MHTTFFMEQKKDQKDQRSFIKQQKKIQQFKPEMIDLTILIV